MAAWTCVLELDASRRVVAGSTKALCHAIGRAADLRIGTEFIHNQHIDTASDSAERIREVAEFGVTHLVDDAWAAGIMSLRQPVDLPTGFGERSSMSFFLYNQDGTQGIARPFLDGKTASASLGRSADAPPAAMPKYHVLDSWDADTNAPSQNFIYDFEVFRYLVNDSWRQVLAHDGEGRPKSGSVEELADAFSSGCAVKIAVAGLCDALGTSPARSHEVFVQAGSCYYYTEQKLFMVGSHPVIRVAPTAPMRYGSGAWDFGWLMVRTDGRVVYRCCDPYTLAFTDVVRRLPVRWFVR